ncbi:MAG: metal-sensing transcriptional repressor [Mogibacterium sp.]|nr:metal-sensing transcriptional repressor [Mogibacterium sp.]
MTDHLHDEFTGGGAHTHVDEQGNVYTHVHAGEHSHTHEHTHGHSHTHSHAHSHAHQKQVINRIARATGHLNSIKRMVEDNRDCSEVLIQLAAVQSALSAVSRIILKDHIEHCIVDAVEQGDDDAIGQLERAIDQLLR